MKSVNNILLLFKQIMDLVRLTPLQIEDICNSIPVNQSLPYYVRLSISTQIRTRLSNDLEKVKIKPHLYEKFKKEIVHYYYKTRAESGTAVGIQCAQSIGERQTQTTLNNFHFAGLTTKTVVVGVPRFSELLNATKSPKMINCTIYLNDEFDSITSLRKRAGNIFTDVKFKRIIKSYELIKDDPLEDWHHLYCSVFKINPSILGWRMRFILDKDALYSYNVTMKMIKEAIMNSYKDAIVLYTPEWNGIVDVFVDESCFQEIENRKVTEDRKEDIEEDVEERENEFEEEELEEFQEEDDEDDKEDKEDKEEKKEKKKKYNDTFHTFKLDSKEDVVPDDIERVIHMEDKVYPALCDIQISGISGITDIFFEKKKNDEWVISTEGSNLYKLFENPLVDKTRTVCNDMWEIYNIFGIEACRQFLIEEYMDVVSSDGTYVNPSNVELLVDIMVYTGTIISISRYGQKKVGCGPMAKASFEESLENFLKAGVNGEKESTDGVSASIMLGKMPKTGTGVFDLMIDVQKVLSSKKIVDTNNKEEIKDTNKNQVEEKEIEEDTQKDKKSRFSKKNNFFD
jgi:DNA-directed RNA polymerase II subunit RPB1